MQLKLFCFAGLNNKEGFTKILKEVCAFKTKWSEKVLKVGLYLSLLCIAIFSYSSKRRKKTVLTFINV